MPRKKIVEIPVQPDDGSTEETHEPGMTLPPVEDDIRRLSRKFSEELTIPEITEENS